VVGQSRRRPGTILQKFSGCVPFSADECGGYPEILRATLESPAFHLVFADGQLVDCVESERYRPPFFAARKAMILGQVGVAPGRGSEPLRRRLGKGSACALSATILGQGFALLTSVVYARLLGRDNLGVFAIYAQLSSLAVAIAALGLGTPLAGGTRGERGDSRRVPRTSLRGPLAPVGSHLGSVGLPPS